MFAGCPTWIAFVAGKLSLEAGVVCLLLSLATTLGSNMLDLFTFPA